MSRKELSKLQILNLEDGQISVRELSDQMMWTINETYWVIKRDGIKVKKVWYEHTKISKESILRFLEMRNLRKSGLLVKQIAIKFGISGSRVSEILQREPYLKYKKLI